MQALPERTNRWSDESASGRDERHPSSARWPGAATGGHLGVIRRVAA